MKVASLLVCAAALAALAACGSEKCPTESPKIDAVASCTAPPGQTFSYKVQLCPTCNMGAITCDVTMTSGQIFLDPKGEACTSSTSCPSPSCANDASCSVTAPSTAGTYTVFAYDPASGQPKQGTLTVVAGAPGSSCL